MMWALHSAYPHFIPRRCLCIWETVIKLYWTVTIRIAFPNYDCTTVPFSINATTLGLYKSHFVARNWCLVCTNKLSHFVHMFAKYWPIFTIFHQQTL